jgi:predicted RNase H-like HicB family nuclease
MIEYKGMDFQIDIREEGEFFARIYVPDVPGPSFFTDDFDTKEEAIEAAKQIIDDHLAIIGML